MAVIRVGSIAGLGLIVFITMVSASLSLAETETAKEGGVAELPKPAADRNAPRVLHDPAKRSILSLAEAMPEEQLLWLQGREFDPDAVMALYLPANKQQVPAGMLILHDQGQHPDWPHIVGDLRKVMPDKGWHTLSLALSYPQQRLVPERTILARSAAGFPHGEANPENSPDSSEVESIKEQPVAELTSEVDIDAGKNPALSEANVAEKSVATADDVMSQRINNTQRIDLALQQFGSLGLRIVSVVAVGEGAHQLLSYLKESQNVADRIQGLVLINARFDHGILTDLQEKVPNWTMIKILDIYDSTRPAQVRAAAERRDYARRVTARSYQSTAIPGLTLLPGGSSQRLVNRIWSWHKGKLISVKK